MDLAVASIFGYGATVCTTLAYAPQVAKAWKTRSTTDITLGMFLLMVVGMACWLIYGFLIGDLPLMIANAITLSLASAILFLKIRHG